MALLRSLSPLLLSLAVPGVAWAQMPPPPVSSPVSPAAAAQEALRALPAAGNRLQFDGEHAARSFSVLLAPGEALGGGTLVLALQSGVSVMPEASFLTVSVNGQRAAILPLGGDKPPATVALAPQMLRSGWNTVSFEASQRHRVDCRMNATYDLWTRIDPTGSGLRFAAQPLPLALADLPRLRRAPDGTMPIRVRTAGQTGEELAAAFSLAAGAARIAGGEAVAVDARPEPLGGAGLEVLAGTAERLRRLGAADAVIAAARSAPQWLAPADGASARIVALAETEADLARVRQALETAGAAPPPGAAPLENAEVSFDALGVHTQEFSGRLFRQELELKLPADSLIADYGRVTLLLDAAYAAGLDRGAGLSLFVNDRLAATLPFGSSAGEEFRQRQIEMPLSAFRPGVNRVLVEARLPEAEDQSCEPQEQIAGAPRFLLLGESRFAVPSLAHMARLPDLASPITASAALGRPDATLRIGLAAEDADTLSAAAAFAARAALSDGGVPLLEIGPVDSRESRAVVVIGAARDIGKNLLEETGLDAQGLLAAADAPAKLALRTGIDPFPTGSILPSDPAAAAADGQVALKAWRMRAREKEDGSLFSAAGASAALHGIGESFGFAAAPAELPPAADIRLAVAQSMTADRDGPLTVITALSPEALAEGMDELARPENWSRLAGRSVFLDGRGKVASVAAAAYRLVPTSPPSLGNIRLVTAAWFSLNPLRYAPIVFALATLFGGLTFLLVRRTGVRLP